MILTKINIFFLCRTLPALKINAHCSPLLLIYCISQIYRHLSTTGDIWY